MRIMAEEQQKTFNVPYQVSCDLDEKVDESSESDDEIKVSDINRGISKLFPYEEVSSLTLVLASDGIWDNIPLN